MIEFTDEQALAILEECRKLNTVGTVPPFYAETGSVNGDQDWPIWIVRNKVCSIGKFFNRETAEALANELNRITSNNERLDVL